MPQRWAFVLVLIVTTLGTVRSRAASTDGRIVGAHRVQAALADLPYVCSVRQQEVHRCSGTVLNPHWLLTSGSCVYDRPPLETLAVVCGVRMYRTVAEMTLHPNFPSSPMGNDLALLMLRKPLNFTSNVQPIPLYDSLELPGTTCGRASIVGFDWYGLVDGPAWWNPPSLQMADVAILSVDECRQRLPAPILSAYLTEANVCTDNGHTGSSTCVGDAGAPVLIATERQRYTLLAIASWTVAPCGTGPSVHVRIAPHLDWILDVIAVSV